MNAGGQVKAEHWYQEPRDRCPPGSCWHRAGGTAHSRGPFWTEASFPLSTTQMKSCICVKESIPWPSSPHFGLKCCLSPLSATLPTKEWYFSLELLSALIGCECLKQLRCSNNCYSCLAPSGETQKLPHELFYLKMIPTCILLQKMGNMSLWPNLAELTKTMASPSLGRVKYETGLRGDQLISPFPHVQTQPLDLSSERFTHTSAKTFPTVVVLLNAENQKKKKYISSLSISFKYSARVEDLQV